MKYSKTTLRELSHRYGQILRKCALINAAILGVVALATPAMAEPIVVTTTPTEENPLNYNGETALHVKEGAVVTLDSEEVTVSTSDANAIYATTAFGSENLSTINLGGANTTDISITGTSGQVIKAGSAFQKDKTESTTGVVNLTASDTITVDGTGTYYGVAAFNESAVKIQGGDVTIQAKYGAIHAQNSTTDATAEDDVATININAKNIYVEATEKTEDGYAVGAISQGVVNLNATESITLKGVNAILTRGDAQVNVNTNDSATVKMDGNISFDYDGPTSGTNVNATVNVKLTGKESYWTGNTIAAFKELNPDYYAEKMAISKMHLTLKDGAKWTATSVTPEKTTDEKGLVTGVSYAALNNLTIDNGTVEIQDKTNGITIDQTLNATDATFTGGKIMIAQTVTEAKINNSKFTNASGKGQGGALHNKAVLTINGGSFTDNIAIKNTDTGTNGTGSAIHNAGTLTIIGTEFTDNGSFDITKKDIKDTETHSGGAIYNVTGSTLTVSGSTFTNNQAAYGGAINNSGVTNTKGSLTITDSNFYNNKAWSQGGAIRNQNDASLIVSASEGKMNIFEGNTSSNGGAIWNGARGNLQITNAKFTKNIAFSDNGGLGQGGAITNGAGGIVTLSGTNEFSGNEDKNGFNDIHNDGTLNISGALTLDGGITGSGIVAFTEGTSLKAKLADSSSLTTLIQASEITGKNIVFVFETGSEGGSLKFEGEQSGFNFAENALYNIARTDEDDSESTTYTFTKKDTSEAAAGLAQETGASQSDAQAAAAVVAGTSDNAAFNAFANEVSTMLQSSDPAVKAAGVKAAAALAPVDAPVVQAHATQAVAQILSAVGARFSGSVAPAGAASGDFELDGGSVWAKGLYNKSKFTGTDGFNAYSRGLALGAEAKVMDNVKVGLGYAYTNSDIKPDTAKTEIDSHSIMLYGEYKPSNWYVNGIAAYTFGDYDETKAVAGLNAKYDVNTIALQAMTGYDFNVKQFTLTPEVGLRYMNIDQKAYTDSFGSRIGANKSDVVTGVVGGKAEFNWRVSDELTLKPQARAALTYDMVNDKAVAVMTLANGAVIANEGKALKRLGAEFALGLTADVTDNLELGISWEGNFRKDYSDNTGLINLKYNF